MNAPDRDTTEPHDSDGEDDDDEGDEEAQEDDGSAKSKRSCAGDDAEAEDEEWTDDMQQEMEDVLEHPLHPDTAFVYQKVRKVSFIPDPKNASLLIILCTCGYPKRIGISCRHIWCVLFTILKCLPRMIDGMPATNVCRCMSTPRTCATCATQIGKFEWTPHHMEFLKMVNLDLGSKIKYHAILRREFDASSLFPAQHAISFLPRISASMFAPFAKSNHPVQSSIVPTSGLPRNQRQERDLDSSPAECGGGGAAASSRRKSNRDEVPTLQRLLAEVTAIWQRTERLKNANDYQLRSQARTLCLTTIRSLGEAVAALHPELEPKRMQRFFTYRDMYMGIARDKD